jgi:tetratricopeptide (TPR) repeat protein
VLVRQLTRSLALVLLGCALVGTISRGAEAEDRRLGAANDLLQLAQTRSHEPEAKKEAPRIDAARRQALLKRRVEQLRKAGKHDAAVSTARRSLALAEQRHGREHPSVATALTTLGGLYARLHRFPEAEQAYKRALDIREKSLGPDHPDTVASLNDLAGLYQTQGKHDLAEQYYKRALAAQEKSLSSDPNIAPDVAGTLTNLATVYQSQGRAGEAAQLTQQAHALREKKSAPSNEIGNAGPQTTFRSERRILPADKSFGGQSAPSVQSDAKTQPDVAPRNPETGKPAVSSAPAQSDWDVVPVFYGTDRDHEQNPKRLAYNADRAHRLELGRALVTVPKSHQVPQVERPWAIRIPYFDVTIYEQAEDPKKHFTL